MKIVISMVVFAITLGVLVINKMDGTEKSPGISFYVGTYTNGESNGIYKYILESNGKLKPIGLATQSANPSFLAMTNDKKYLVSVNELEEGMIESFLIEGDTLKSLSKKSSGGSYPCFVAVNKQGYVINSNYGNGAVGLQKVNSKGELSDLLDIQQHIGSGTTSRQKGPHAHSAWFQKDDQSVIAVDLGTNDLWFSKIDNTKEKFVPQAPNKLAMPEGAGPRHMTFYPGEKWAYVLNELSSSVSLIEKSTTGTYEIVNSISTLPTGYDKPNSCADIHITADGKFLYASNRGHNSIVIYKIDSDNGNLTLVGHENTRGETPRNFSLSPDDHFLLVANQKTNSIVSFKRNKKSGTLEFVDEVESPTPVCILF